MADKSAIEWTDATWTPIRARNKATGKVGWHCEHDSEGCRVCYAEGINKRLGTGLDFKPGHRAGIELFLDEKMLLAPLSWKRPRMIFVCSMTDAFAEFVPDEWIDRLFAIMALCPQHTFQVLTKRSARMREYTNSSERLRAIVSSVLDVEKTNDGMREAAARFRWPLPNVWKMVSCEDHPNAKQRIPDLLNTRAAVRGVSAEPLLGPINFTDIGEITFSLNALTGEGRHLLGMRGKLPGLDWIIVGGESGPKARAMGPDWARSIRDQCAASDVPFFFKQWGEYAPCATYIAREDMRRVGKKAAGRLLDGRTHDDFPRAAI